MSDKSKKSVSGGSERHTGLKKRPTVAAKIAKEPNKTPSTVQPLEQVTQQEQEVSAPEPTDMVEQQKGYQISEPSEKPEIDSASSFFSPPKLDEATTSSPVLTRTGSNLLRIRTQIKQAKAAEILRAMSEAEETGDSDVDSGDTNISLDASTRSIGGSRMLLNELPRHANEILQRAKADLEKSGNLKREIRESVVAGLYTLYEMILKLSDSRMLHMLESSKQKANVSRESERLTQRHARFMHETLGQYALLKDSIEKLQKETESTRLIVSYDLCEAMTATRREITNIRSDTNLDSNLANQLRIITEEIKQLRGDMMSSHKPVTLEERQFPIAEELGELRRITQELSTKTKQSMSPNRGEETIRIEQLAKTTTELQQHITDTKVHLTADVQELKKEVHTISQDIKSLAAICSSSSFPSVQASLEELRKDTKELRDTALDSTAPIRVAIESLRTELKQRTDIEGTELRGFSHLPGEHYTERYQHTLMLQQKKFPRSFSEVVAKPNYPLIVESIDPRRTSDDVIKQIKGGVDVVDLGIGINHIRKAKNQKVLISCESEGDRNTLQDQLKSTANQLTVHRPATKFPLIRLTGVVFDLTDGKIVEAVMKQNATLLNDIPASQNHIKVIRRTKGRTSSTCNVILEIERKLMPTVPIPLIARNARSGVNGTGLPEQPFHTAKGTEVFPQKHSRAIKIAQVNLGRGFAALQECLKTAESQGISIILVQEPYVGAKAHVTCRHRVIQKQTNDTQKPVKSAVIVVDSSVQYTVNPDIITENIVACKFKIYNHYVAIINIYMEGAQDVGQDLRIISNYRNILDSENIIIGGDLNAKSPWWGCDVEDRRGTAISESFAQLELHILNTGKTPTFWAHRGNRDYTSIVDVTACSNGLLNKITNWRVNPDFVTLSDHRAITYSVNLEKITAEATQRQTTRIYNTGKADWASFTHFLKEELKVLKITEESITEIGNTDALEDLVQQYVDCIQRSSDKAIPKLAKTISAKTPWWKKQLSDKKKM
ncbi:unnamed protein product [Parnassius mnemosyne]|uniref:Endonuclease/exonuclease/phosphatase domain-containing protein n=1 Tax=Parnassius mnemosyne TaxID=213953 RepID=A0AAV1M1B6_9NEOP